MDGELWMLYATALTSLITIVTMLVMSIIVLATMQKGIRKIYDLFSFLHKESEQRIGKANTIVTQCTATIERAAIASERCSEAAERSVRLAEKIENDCLKEIEELKKERNLLLAKKDNSTPKVEYTTHNYR